MVLVPVLCLPCVLHLMQVEEFGSHASFAKLPLLEELAVVVKEAAEEERERRKEEERRLKAAEDGEWTAVLYCTLLYCTILSHAEDGEWTTVP